MLVLNTLCELRLSLCGDLTGHVEVVRRHGVDGVTILGKRNRDHEGCDKRQENVKELKWQHGVFRSRIPVVAINKYTQK